MRRIDQPLPRDFYDRDVVIVARELIGKRLLRQSGGGPRLVGRIVEVEAYLAAGDPACHAFRGRTRRNASMFGPPGRAYVYAIHARHCLNVVTEPPGVPSAVLIRSVEPVEGVELMLRRRRLSRRTAARVRAEAPPAGARHDRPDRDAPPRLLTSGPARLCEAFDIDRALDGWDLVRGRTLWIADALPGDGPRGPILAGPRIGVTSARELPLRFFEAGNRIVSRR